MSHPVSHFQEIVTTLELGCYPLRIRLGIATREHTLDAVQLAGPPVVSRVGTLDELDPISDPERQVTVGLYSQQG